MIRHEQSGSLRRWALPLLLASGAVACSKPRAEEPTALPGEVKKQQAVRVRTVPIEQREMVQTTTTTTTVESEAEIEVFPRAAGIVTELLVEEGDVVSAGDVLAVLDQREARVALREAELSLAEARDGVAAMELAREEATERLERAKLTWQQSVRDVERNEKAGLISQADLDQLKLARDQAYRDLQASRIAVDAAIQNEKSSATAVEKAQVTIERQQLTLSFTEIVAPFDGVVARRTVRIGDTVSSAASVFVLTDPDNLRAIFARPQRDLPLFRSATRPLADGQARTEPGGIEITAHTEAIPGEIFRGEIELVSPTIDAASGSFRVTVRLDPDDSSGRTSSDVRLLPGMLVRLDIVTDRHPDALVIPKRALQREGDTNFMYVVRDDVAHRVEVREGFSDDEFVEIFTVDEGVIPGERVVAVGNRDLEEGDSVEPENWEAKERGAEESGPGDDGSADTELVEGSGTGADDSDAGRPEDPGDAGAAGGDAAGSADADGDGTVDTPDSDEPTEEAE